MKSTVQLDFGVNNDKRISSIFSYLRINVSTSSSLIEDGGNAIAVVSGISSPLQPKCAKFEWVNEQNVTFLVTYLATAFMSAPNEINAFAVSTSWHLIAKWSGVSQVFCA